MKLHHILFCTKLWLVKTFKPERYKRYFCIKFKLDKNKPTFTQTLVMLERLRRYQIHGIRGKTDYVTVFFYHNHKPKTAEAAIPWDSFLELLYQHHCLGFRGDVTIWIDRGLHIKISPQSSGAMAVRVLTQKQDNNRFLHTTKRLSKLWPLELI